MASTTVTYADLKEFVRDHLWEGFTETDARLIDEAITGGIRELARSRQWSFLETSVVIQTVAPVSFTASIAKGSATLTADTSVFAATDVGKYITLTGADRFYRIAAYVSGTVVTLERNSVSTSQTSTAAVMYTLDYDLPADFRSLESLTSLDDMDPSPITIQQMDFLHANQPGSGQPVAYFLGISPDDGKQIIRFFKAPDDIYEYKLWYHKMPQAEGYSDSDYIDWPDAMMHLLKASILNSMAQSRMMEAQDANLRMRRYEDMIRKQSADDSLHRRRRRKAGGGRQRRTGFNKRGYYTETDVSWL